MMRNRFAVSLGACVVATSIAGAVHAQAGMMRLEATPSWQVEGSEAGEAFTDLRDYVVLNNGYFWARDFKEQNIRRYDANGKSLSVVVRKGAGPGALENANGMAVAPDGNLFWLTVVDDAMPTIVLSHMTN